MNKIFVRERRHVGEGAGRPRYAIVAAQGEINVFKTRVRRAELEKIAAATDAEIVYLPRGEGGDQGERQGRKRHRRQHD